MKHDFVLTPNGNYRNNLHYLRPKVEVAAAEVTAIAGSQLQNAARKLLQVESTMGPQGALTCLSLPCIASPWLVARTDGQRAKQLGMQQKMLANN